MKVVALISGGKDSCFSMMHAVAEGHEIVALANLYPSSPNKDELDSYMYQTVGHEAIHLYSEAMELPLFRRKITGSSKSLGLDYTQTDEDEVEDLYELLQDIKTSINFDAVASGAILSDYQRIRVESICARLNVKSLSYLWRRNQDELFQEMVSCGVSAILIKTAALGLDPRKHLGKTLDEMSDTLHALNAKYGCHVCGEGGEFETFTLDCPLFRKKIVIDEADVIIHSDDYFAPVGYLKLKEMHLEPKASDVNVSIGHLRLKTSEMWAAEYISKIKIIDQEEDVLIAPTQVRWKEHVYSEMKFPVSHTCGGKFLTISNMRGTVRHVITSEAVEEVTLQVLNQIKDILLHNNHNLQNVCYIQINVSDMAHYKHINKVYSQFFNFNPPARACIGCIHNADREDDKVVLQMYCVSCKEQQYKKAMHVQGISHWAPANIGPFSQCVAVDGILFMSGTIGLVPSSMELIQGGAAYQAMVALDHVQSVMLAMTTDGIKNLLQCICYVTQPEDIIYGIQAWKRVTESEENNFCNPLYLVINELPKAAAAEWQGIGYQGGEQDDSSIDSGNQYHDHFESDWNLVKISSGNGNIYAFATSIAKHQEVQDLDECVKCVQENLQSQLKSHGLITENVVQASLFCASGGINIASIQGAWKRTQNECGKIAVTPVTVQQIFRNDRFCVLSLVCCILA